VRLAEEGANIIAVDICAEIPHLPYDPATEADLAETARLVEALDHRIISRKADVRDEDALRAVVDEGVAEFGHLDIVVSNAGIGTFPYAAVDLGPKVWQDMLDINLTGGWNTIRVSIPHLIANEGGAVIITSSAAALTGYANLAHYTAAKTGLVGLCRSLAAELGPSRIRVNTIAPTQVATEMLINDEIFKLFCPDKEAPTIDDFSAVSQAMHMLPIPWVESIDISNAVLFLASDEGRYITGVTLPIDAGNSAS
jgi:SDR family mycofactocin-dependent oxidoreductase